MTTLVEFDELYKNFWNFVHVGQAYIIEKKNMIELEERQQIEILFSYCSFIV